MGERTLASEAGYSGAPASSARGLFDSAWARRMRPWGEIHPFKEM